MAKWDDVEREEPAFAARVRALFDARKHKTLATLRADGSPRISGIEVEFNDGELTFGSMPGARKGTDLVRDPRFALHGPSGTPGRHTSMSRRSPEVDWRRLPCHLRPSRRCRGLDEGTS